ncbi:MAG: RDD family protein [Thiobacillaceae bacterium]
MRKPAIPQRTPSIKRRLASMFYEAVLLVALWITAGFLFLGLHRDASSGSWRVMFQVYLVAVTGIYFVSFWRWGQTLPMKTWRIRLTDSEGQRPRVTLAALRYLLAWPSLSLLGVGIFWALVDRDRQFLHDRLTGLRLVDTQAEA